GRSTIQNPPKTIKSRHLEYLRRDPQFAPQNTAKLPASPIPRISHNSAAPPPTRNAAATTNLPAPEQSRASARPQPEARSPPLRLLDATATEEGCRALRQLTRRSCVLPGQLTRRSCDLRHLHAKVPHQPPASSSSPLCANDRARAPCDTDARPILRHSQQSPIFLTLECPTISLLLKGERKTPTASNETAKTTQKIVLKLQYLSCKYYSQHAIKFMKNGQEYEKRFRSHTR
ncbi:hypothetical protein EJB05_40010, partial [Eragrostis curvula]